MTTVRMSLSRLGWPIGNMSDSQITQELYRRWFAARPSDAEEDDAPVSVATSTGIFVSMATEGNLDALCWSENDSIPDEDVVSAEDEAIFSPPPEPEPFPPVAERRRSPRRPAKDIVRWRRADGDGPNATGWLVDRSEHGVAFIVPADEAPARGDEIVPSMMTRNSGQVELGQATVVRVDSLNADLSLICAQLAEPQA
jgi:hypothetical protein